MEPVSGNELKLRGYEAPVVTVLGVDHSLLVDGPSSGPGSAAPSVITSTGTAKITPADVPSMFATPPKVPLVVSGVTNLYLLGDAIGNQASMYLGPFYNAPISDNSGHALRTGHTYFNLTDERAYIWSAAGRWVVMGQAAPAVVRAYYYLPDADTGMCPPLGAGAPDLKGQVLSFDISGPATAVDAVNVYLNGALLANSIDYTMHEGSTGTGDWITFSRTVEAGSVIVVQIFGKPDVSFAADAVGIDTATWVYDGAAVTYSLLDFTGTAVVPGNAVNCLVSYNQRIIQPGVGYAVSGSTITFMLPPLPGDIIWITVGLPVGDGLVAGLDAARVAVVDKLAEMDTLKTELLALKVELEALLP